MRLNEVLRAVSFDIHSGRAHSPGGGGGRLNRTRFVCEIRYIRLKNVNSLRGSFNAQRP